MEETMLKQFMTRRGFSLGLLAVPAFACSGFVQTSLAQAALPKMIVSKDPGCDCCDGWIDYLRKASCHTAEIGGYVIEGHVPYPSIRKLLTEKPRAVGLSVPGMPQSAPGMDVPGSSDVYEVVMFGSEGRKRYGRFRGRKEI
jgi:hypothetical protein